MIFPFCLRENTSATFTSPDRLSGIPGNGRHRGAGGGGAGGASRPAGFILTQVFTLQMLWMERKRTARLAEFRVSAAGSRCPHIPDPTGGSLSITFSSKGGAVLLCWLLVTLGLQESSSVHLRGFTLQPEPPNPPSWR